MIIVMSFTNYCSAIGNLLASDPPLDWKDASSNPRPIELDVVFSWGFPHHLQTNVGSVPILLSNPRSLLPNFPLPNGLVEEQAVWPEPRHKTLNKY